MASNQISQLEAQLRKIVAEVLRDEVYSIVEQTELEHIESDVYSVYDPSYYERRYSNGGMLDENNIKLNDIDDLTIFVTNETPANMDYNASDKNLPELIEYGHGYNGQFYDYPVWNSPFMGNRNFTENTIQDLHQNHKIEKALKEGLRKRGVQTT